MRFGITARACLVGTSCLLTAIGLAAASARAGSIWEQAIPPSGTVPLGLETPMRVPADNPQTQAKIALGRRLFFDRALSVDGSTSCATCHDPASGFADTQMVAVGVQGRAGRRNSPTLVNRGYGELFFWDGRRPTLEAQVLDPIADVNELGSSVDVVASKLQRNATYAGEFRRVFGAPVSPVFLGRALASYVRTIQSGDSPFDRFMAGDRSALSAEQQIGFRVFRGRGLCTTCHTGATLTDEKFHNTGVAWNGEVFRDDGRAAITGQVDDRGAFKTPTLREVARTAPYMHNGSLQTLDDVVDFYVRGGRQNPNLDPELMPLKITAAEKTALAAFMRALTGTVTEGR